MAVTDTIVLNYRHIPFVYTALYCVYLRLLLRLMDLKRLPVTMSNDENKCDKIQPSTISKNKSAAIESVIAPEVKILNRGDLLGAINCLFPELQLKSGRKYNVVIFMDCWLLA